MGKYEVYLRSVQIHRFLVILSRAIAVAVSQVMYRPAIPDPITIAPLPLKSELHQKYLGTNQTLPTLHNKAIDLISRVISDSADALMLLMLLTF